MPVGPPPSDAQRYDQVSRRGFEVEPRGDPRRPRWRSCDDHCRSSPQAQRLVAPCAGRAGKRHRCARRRRVDRGDGAHGLRIRQLHLRWRSRLVERDPHGRGRSGDGVACTRGARSRPLFPCAGRRCSQRRRARGRSRAGHGVRLPRTGTGCTDGVPTGPSGHQQRMGWRGRSGSAGRANHCLAPVVHHRVRRARPRPPDRSLRPCQRARRVVLRGSRRLRRGVPPISHPTSCAPTRHSSWQLAWGPTGRGSKPSRSTVSR